MISKYLDQRLKTFTFSGSGSSFLHSECWDRAGEDTHGFHLYEPLEVARLQGELREIGKTNRVILLHHLFNDVLGPSVIEEEVDPGD